MTRLASFALLATTIWIVVKMAQVEGQLSFNARPWPSWPKEEDEDENPAVNKVSGNIKLTRTVKGKMLHISNVEKEY